MGQQDSLVFKVVDRDDWEAARKSGEFRGAAIDLKDGYIHFSTKAQVEETVAKHFAGQSNLLLVAVDARALSDELKWEPSRGGDLFPHLYQSLSFQMVVWEAALVLDDEGDHCFPNKFRQYWD